MLYKDVNLILSKWYKNVINTRLCTSMSQNDILYKNLIFSIFFYRPEENNDVIFINLDAAE